MLWFAPHGPEDLLRGILLGDDAVAKTGAPARELGLEQRVVERAHDQGDRLSEQADGQRPDLPAAEVRREQEDAPPASARRQEVLDTGQGRTVQKVLARQIRRLQEVHEGGAEGLDAPPGDRGDLSSRLFRECRQQVL